MKIRWSKDRLKVWLRHYKEACVLGWPGLPNFSIWAVGFVILFGLTVKDFIPLVRDYRYHNDATAMSIETEPVPPNFTICLPYWSTYLFTNLKHIRSLPPEYLNGSKSTKNKCARCYDMEVAGWDFWTDLNATQLNSTKFVLRYVVEKFYEKNLHKVPLSEDNFHYMMFLVDAVWYYFSWIYEYDLYVLTSPEFTGLKDVSWKSHEALDWLPRKAADELYSYLLDAIAQCVYGECYEKKTNIDPFASRVYPDFRINETITIIGDEFCFPAPTEFGTKDFLCSYNRAYNRSKGFPFPWLWDRYPSSDFKIFPSPSVLYSPVEDKDAIYATSLDVKRNKNESEHVFINYFINQRLVAKKPGDHSSCSNESYVEVCMAKELLSVAIRDCHCVPFTFRMLQEDDNTSLPYCNSTHYESCAQKVRRDHFEQIEQTCNKKCSYTFYAWDSRPSVKYNEFNATTPQYFISFGPSKSPFVEFGFEPKFTSEQFISQVGGVVNLYLGISGLTLFAFVILCFDQSRHWKKYRKETIRAKRERKRESLFDIWQLFRFIGIFHTLGQDARDTGPVDEEFQNETTAELSGLKTKVDHIDKTLSELSTRMRKIESMLEKLSLSQQSVSEAEVEDVKL